MDEGLPDIEVQRKMVLSMVRAVLGTQRYTYLSGPITTGRRFVEWQREHGRPIADADEWKRERVRAVITPSCDALFQEAETLRGSGRHVIDPGSFEARDRMWQQSDYYRLWDEVITAHASEVCFVNGWEFSAGCVLEYGCALKCGRPTRTMAGEDMSKAAAFALIQDALVHLRDEDEQITKLRDDIIRYRAAIEME
ncbi:MAG: hypothetical protein QOI38_2872 [Sphingomonadales bacterium]|jgi:alpha-D-ribose 1-methylphosphonate 5-triphosphate synthase subunit PhnG|nr:hypothetical protein [Sphingomonadales bacterium]